MRPLLHVLLPNSRGLCRRVATHTRGTTRTCPRTWSTSRMTQTMRARRLCPLQCDARFALLLHVLVIVSFWEDKVSLGRLHTCRTRSALHAITIRAHASCWLCVRLSRSLAPCLCTSLASLVAGCKRIRRLLKEKSLLLAMPAEMHARSTRAASPG